MLTDRNNSNMALLNTDPMDCFLFAIRHSSLEVRVYAFKNVSAVANVIGAERTRLELLPYLGQRYRETEVLLALSEVLGTITECVGGRDYAYCLLPLLEKLVDDSEDSVRNKALDSLKNISLQLSTEDHEKYFMPLIIRLCNGDWFTSRAAACGLFICCYFRVSDDLKTVLRSKFCTLCEDDTRMVRLAAVLQLDEFIKVIEPEIVKSEMLPMITKLAKDDWATVKQLALMTAIFLPEEYANDESMGIFKHVLEGRFWIWRPVRSRDEN